MNLMRKYLKDHLKRAKKEDKKIRVIGDKTGLPEDIQGQIREVEAVTKDKKGICLNLALNYGGRDEILRAVRQIIQECKSDVSLESRLDEQMFSRYLDTADTPDPDLMIRTSGELRTSNFLPWQLAYSEFYFADCLWPDFDDKQLDLALAAYGNRKRRFGKSE